MLCAQRAVLEKVHSDAGAKFDAARQRLEKRIGIGTRDEYATLKLNADIAWQELGYARSLLDTHIRRHGC